MVVVIVLKVNIVVVQMKLQNVKCVCQVFTQMNQDKVLVYHVFQVNLMMLLVPWYANLAKRILFQLLKIVPFPVTFALPVGRPIQAAPNVLLVRLVNLKKKKNATNAPLDLRKVKQTKKYAPNAQKVPKHQHWAVVFALLVNWVNSMSMRVKIVQHAHGGSTKIPKGKSNALNAHWVKRTSMPSRRAVSVIWVSTAVPTALVPNVWRADIKTAKVKQLANNATSIRI